MSGHGPTAIAWQLPNPIPPPTGSSIRIVVFADLVQSPCRSGVRAVGDPLAVDVQRAAPLAVVVAVEAEVEPGAEVEAGVAERPRS